eukprot:1083373-Pelagomonas_calceolata.AAC.1
MQQEHASLSLAFHGNLLGRRFSPEGSPPGSLRNPTLQKGNEQAVIMHVACPFPSSICAARKLDCCLSTKFDFLGLLEMNERSQKMNQDQPKRLLNTRLLLAAFLHRTNIEDGTAFGRKGFRNGKCRSKHLSGSNWNQ